MGGGGAGLGVALFSGDNFSPYKRSHSKIDCEQSLFLFRFSEGSARAHASGEAARRERRGRQPWETNSFFVSTSRFFSHARGNLFVSCVLVDGPRKKERLRVVYSKMAF